jgi:uncharacterized membrane protein YdjX (TVP38/TMEM64 family)
MRALLFRLLLIASVLLAVYFFVEWRNPQLLEEPLATLRRHDRAAALVSFGLLAADIALPVPSSLVMIANGAVFGVIAGMMLSTAASVVSAALGFWIGRRGARWLVPSGEELPSMVTWVDRWGALAIAASRPVPLLAESISILAGSAGVSLRTFLAASLAGSAPASAIYAYAGARAVEPAGVPFVFLVTLLLASALWFAGYRLMGDS